MYLLFKKLFIATFPRTSYIESFRVVLSSPDVITTEHGEGQLWFMTFICIWQVWGRDGWPSQPHCATCSHPHSKEFLPDA